MYDCGSCDDCFCDAYGLEVHLDDYQHERVECETCTRTFKTWASCRQHMNAIDHWSKPYSCDTCSMVFRNYAETESHMDNRGHWKHYCADCQEHFQNENNLHMHLNSRIHRGAIVKCPFCRASYTAASGLCHHLERGACPEARGLNREKILQIIRERDPKHLITNKQITWQDTQTKRYSANDSAWNGSGWSCGFCSREFRSRTALNQHLNSPIHQQKVYRCPNRGCGKEFTSLAGLFGHLESESCAFMKFETVQKQVGRVVGSSRLIAF